MMTADKYRSCKRRLLDLGYTEDEAALWLNAPHPQLKGKRAADCDYSEVSAVLGRLESGAYL